MTIIFSYLNDFWYIMKLQWSINKLSIFKSIGQMLLSQASTFVNIYATAEIVNFISNSITGSGSLFSGRLLFLVLLLLLCDYVPYIYSVVFNFTEKQKFIIVNEELSARQFRKMTRIKMEYFEDSRLYSAQTNIGGITGENLFMMVNSFSGLIGSIITIVGVTGIFISYNFFICLLFLAFYIPFFIYNIKKSETVYLFNKSNIETHKRLNSIYSFIVSRKALQEIKLFNAAQFLIKRRKKIFSDLRKKTFRLNIKLANKGMFINIPPQVCYMAVYFYYAMRVLFGKFSISQFTVIVNSIERFTGALESIIRNFSVYPTYSQMIKDYRNFYEYAEERPSTGKLSCDSCKHIELKNVSYKYPGSDVYALRNIDIQISKGDKIAIVGFNGAGKSTLAKLIVGLYNEYEGEIFVDGREYRSFGNTDIYNLFTVAMQDYCKYPLTMRENIILSDPYSTLGNYTYAAELSDVSSIYEKLKYKDETFLNKQYDDNGTDLSEGQWHSVILARTLYRSRPIVVFDEPTSSLDPYSEQKFIDNILRDVKSRGKTSIVISHRLINMKDYDDIIVMKEGKIVERGTHYDLISKGNLYKEMWAAQAEKYGGVKSLK